MQFIRANRPVRVTPTEELPGKVNYFLGNDPAMWRTGIPTYAKVVYEDVYPGVDVTSYGNQRQLEYDFTVGPGADPRRIALRFQGADAVELDSMGDLVLRTRAGPVRQPKPQIYQDIDGHRRAIPGGYVLHGPSAVGFEVGTYDASQTLIIDPVLGYSTYLGGSAAELGADVAVDSAGSAYVTGYTLSSDFPTTAGAFDTTFNHGVQDVFVTKLDPTGSPVYLDIPRRWQ